MEDPEVLHILRSEENVYKTKDSEVFSHQHPSAKRNRIVNSPGSRMAAEVERIQGFQRVQSRRHVPERGLRWWPLGLSVLVSIISPILFPL